MNDQIVSLRHVVLLSRHPDVALLEVVALMFWRNHYPQANVKLACLD